MEVVIQPLNRVIRVAPGANLLQALQAARVPLSYSCMAGRCGTCRCRVIRGEVLDQGSEQQSSPSDDGYVLACQTYITQPCTIEIPEPDEVVVHPARILKAVAVAVESLTHDIKRVVLKSNKPFEYSPGQYALLQFTPDCSRPYSLAGLCSQKELEFHVRLVPDGRVSSHVDQTLKVGDTVKVSGPLGSAYLRRKHQGPILCVAGGTGLAPILSIVRGAVAEGMRNPIHLYFGVRSPRDIYGMDWLDELKSQHRCLKTHIIVTSGGNPRTHRCGVVTDAIEHDLHALAGWRAYVCGSPPMVEAVSVLAKRLGVLADQLYADAFYAQGA